MDVLPVELFINILKNLDQTEKTKCMLVCQRWYAIIRYSVLLHDLTIQTKHVNTIFQMTENGIIDGSKVKNLTLKNQDYSHLVHLKLNNMFPKLQKLVWSQPPWSSFSLPESSPSSLEGRTKHASDLSCIEITGFENSISDLLRNTVFTNLTAIALHLHKIKDDIQLGQRTIEAVMKIPRLERIHISRCELDISQFERLHRLLPRLSEIHLSQVSFKAVFDFDPSRAFIEPAVAIKSFKVNRESGILDDGLTWIDYFSKKYTHVNEFELDCHVPFCDDTQSSSNHIEACQRIHSTLLSQFTTNLKNYSVPNKTMDRATFDRLASMNIQLTVLKFKYNHQGWNAFQKSEQIHSVQELEMTNCPSSILLKDIQRLETVALICDSNNSLNENTFDLAKTLTGCRTKHIKIQAPYISSSSSSLLAHSMSSFNTFTMIQSLNLKTHSVNNRVWHFVSQYCPFLKNIELYLTTSILPDNDRMYINLPGHSLNSVILRLKGGCYFYKLMLQYDIRWFELEFGTRKSKNVNEISDCEYEWLEEQYFASIRCLSILNFDIDIV